jgi:ABC-type branched-subunit amino acid transport system substrate-binding protein
MSDSLSWFGRLALRTAFGVLLGIALAACSNTTAPSIGQTITGALREAPSKTDLPPVAGAATRDSLKVGLLLPLSGGGQTALIAETLRKAAELAVVEQNIKHVELIVRDDKGTPEGARAAAHETLGAGAAIVLGPLFAKSVAAAATATRAASRALVAFSSDATVAAPDTHLIGFFPTADVERVIGFAATRGKRRIAALIPDDDFGRLIDRALSDAAQRHDLRIAGREFYGDGAASSVEPARRIGALISDAERAGQPIDAVFVPGGEDRISVIAPLLRQAGIDTTKIKLLGTGGLDYANVGRNGDLIGAWFAGPDPRGWREFAERYGRAYGYAPPRIASLAYDAATIALTLADSSSGQFLAGDLTRDSGFQGVDGPIRLRSDGRAERALAILEVQSFGINVIEPASTFGGPGGALSGSGFQRGADAGGLGTRAIAGAITSDRR